ncbi:MAG: peptidase, partial [Treponema sp.]|nr:peptidase [Treponema sp.]
MIIRTKSGNYQAGNASALLDFLGLKKEEVGLQKIAADIELIAAVPFCLAADVEAGQGFPWT